MIRARDNSGMMRPEDEALLDQVPAFSLTAPEIRQALVRAGTVKVFRKGAILWRRGARASSVIVILSGRVGLFDGMDLEQSAVIDLFSAGAVAGSGYTLLDPPHFYLFSGKALDDVRALVIPIPVYRRHVQRDHSLLLGTARQLLAGWQRLVAETRALKQLSANQRLAAYLLAQTDKETGAVTVRLTDDQLLIARLLGVTRESLSRSFAILRAQGVSKRGRLVTLSDVTKLRQFCN